MRLFLHAIAALSIAGCQYIIEIPDRELGSGDGDGDGDIDAGIDAPLAGECNPLTQEGCDDGEKCTSTHGPSSTTVCAPDGTVGINGPCAIDAAGIDDCVGDAICDPSGVCKRICRHEPGSCGSDNGSAQTCQAFVDEVFADQTGVVGVCQRRCDPVLQDCGNIETACYLDVGIGEGQCLEPFDFGGGQGQQGDPCGGGCEVSGCDPGFGPHLSAIPGDPPDSCTRYCRPVNTHTGNPGSAGGDLDEGACAGSGVETGDGGEGGPGGSEQCRFLQTALEVPLIPATIGMCVEPDAEWKDCRLCDLDNAAATCGAGCVDQATLDSL